MDGGGWMEVGGWRWVDEGGWMEVGGWRWVSESRRIINWLLGRCGFLRSFCGFFEATA